MDDITADSLDAELALLRRGHGIAGADADKLGPALRRLAGVSDDTPTFFVRSAVLKLLLPVIDRLPRNDAVVAQAMYGLDDLAGPRLSERLLIVADRLSVSERTVNRFARRVNREIAERLSAGSAADPDSDEVPTWHVTEMSALVRLDGPAPIVIERRRIIAERDGLEQVEMRASLPRRIHREGRAGELFFDVIQGAQLLTSERLSDSHYRYTLGLPRPLAAGETHEYATSLSVLTADDMRPYYVFTPLWRCERFDVRLRFDPQNLPQQVTLIEGVPPRVLDDEVFQGKSLTVDAVGETHVSFDQPRLGFSYGISWR